MVLDEGFFSFPSYRNFDCEESVLATSAACVFLEVSLTSSPGCPMRFREISRDFEMAYQWHGWMNKYIATGR